MENIPSNDNSSPIPIISLIINCLAILIIVIPHIVAMVKRRTTKNNRERYMIRTKIVDSYGGLTETWETPENEHTRLLLEEVAELKIKIERQDIEIAAKDKIISQNKNNVAWAVILTALAVVFVLFWNKIKAIFIGENKHKPS